MDKNYRTIPSWIKAKGYLHLTPSLDVNANWKNIELKITNPNFVKKYAFYPLIHSVIRERKYKKIDSKKFILRNKNRSHKLKNFSTNKTISSAKERPLHYSTHFDSIIYTYYAYLLQIEYEKKLNLIPGLSACITAYRKLKIDEGLPDDTKGNGKSTIHFAKEIFDEVKLRSVNEDVAVLAFDIKSFFSSLDHKRLKDIWKFVMNFDSFPDDHKAVFKASTEFSYVLLEDLRIGQKKNSRKSGFDEKKLSYIRKTKGYKCFFESNQDFRNHIKSGKLKIHKFPFWNKKENRAMGIPQGLPNSAILANIYLYYFDLEIFNNLAIAENCFYRRYSDDIIVVCNANKIPKVKTFVENQMKENLVDISKDKTEVFKFKFTEFNKNRDKRLTCVKVNDDGSEKYDTPLTYLGFEFRGYNTLVKSANIAKFYRRIISIVNRRAKRANKNLKSNPSAKNAIFINQIKKLYKQLPKKKDSENEKTKLGRKILVMNAKGEFDFKLVGSKRNRQSNYFSYLKRVSSIMNDQKINMQLRKSKHILHTAIKKSLSNNLSDR